MTSSYVITGQAACTALGYSVDATMAAMGAGLSNFSDTPVRNLLGDPAVAAMLPDVDPEAARGRRLEVLMRFGLEDLDVLIEHVDGATIPVVMATANDLDAHERQVIKDALDRHGRLEPAEPWQLPYGRSAGFAALRAAVSMLDSGSADAVVVGAVDSLCAPPILRALAEAGRVLGPGTEGSIPGEASAFALLCKPHLANGRLPAAVLEAIALRRADRPFLASDTVDADALTAAFGALRATGAARVDCVVAAHSGEGYFGRSFAHAYLRESELMPEPLDVELTADCLGDVGAAAPLLGVALASYVMGRQGRGRRALVYSESDSGEVGAAIISAVSTPADARLASASRRTTPRRA